MWNVLLFIHIVVAILLIIVILLQQTSSDSLSGIGAGNNMGLISAKSAANFLTKITIILAALFCINSIVLANLSSKKSNSLYRKIENRVVEEQEVGIPIAK